MNASFFHALSSSPFPSSKFPGDEVYIEAGEKCISEEGAVMLNTCLLGEDLLCLEESLKSLQALSTCGSCTGWRFRKSLSNAASWQPAIDWRMSECTSHVSNGLKNNPTILDGK